MKRILLSFSALVIFLLSAMAVQAQEHSGKHRELAVHDFKHWNVGMMMYHTYIVTQILDVKETLIVPSVGLDVEYWFNDKWGLGLHNDLEVISFKVERRDSHALVRETPLLLTLDGLLRLWKGLVFLAGPGVEFEKEKNLFVVRSGLEYEIELGSHWDVTPTFFYDSRIDAYNTYSVGFGIGKRFQG